MFTAYREEDDFKIAEVAERIAQFMSEQSGVKVNADDVKWEACVDSFSMYSAIIETQDGVSGIIVKKVGDNLTVL